MTKRAGTREREKTIAVEKYDALLFDLDGVITDSMRLHAAAWRQLFDEYLQERARRAGDPFTPFDIAQDYRNYVDGKPRYDGVSSFLAARGITLPYGDPQDEPSRETVCGLGNKKDGYLHAQLRVHKVDVYESAVQLLRRARERGLKTAVVSSSKNCKQIVESVGLETLFDTRVDGTDVEEKGLPGKPAPDMFLEAAKRLGVEPPRAVVFEDAISGVQAGHSGGFGLVVGVDRLGHPEDLVRNGADVVVSDLAELSLT